MSAPIVMVHGAFCGGWAFEQFRRPFEAGGHEVLAPDLPGHEQNAPADAVVGVSMRDYADHIAEFDKTALPDKPKYPVIFTKATSAVIGPDDPIEPHKNVTEQVDYEGELAVVIGKEGSDIPISEAMNHVYGFTILNDVTARDLQANHGQWFHGKSLDTFCPMGPYLLLRDAAPETFDIITKVNGEVRQDGSTGEFIFTIPELIHTISQGTTLFPGDVIATGTPSGVGVGFNPPRFLHSGDTVEITIPAIGTLKNKVK